MPRGPAQLVHRQPVPALVARARVPPAAPPAPDDHRHVDQVLVVLVAEEALAQLGQPVLSALQGAHELLLPVAQQDVVVGPLSDEGLVVVEVLAGRPPLHVAVLRVEAPRRVRRRSEGARVLHRLHAPVGEVLVVLELVGVVLQDPELRGRLLLHVLGRAVHRLLGPRVVGPGRPLEVVAPLPALARHPRGQVLLQRLDAPVHHGNGVAVLGPLRAVHSLRQLPVQRGELVAQVRRDHEVPVVPRQLLCGALGGAAHRLGVLVLQRFHGGLPGEDAGRTSSSPACSG